LLDYKNNLRNLKCEKFKHNEQCCKKSFDILTINLIVLQLLFIDGPLFSDLYLIKFSDISAKYLQNQTSK